MKALSFYHNLAPLHLTWLLLSVFIFGSTTLSSAENKRPNILWLTSEDNGPHLGCYGDTYADTPHIDALAKKGSTYLNAWSTAPVCAPARTTIISGIFPPATGAEHMRSQLHLPEPFKMYPQYLKEAGYFCTNRKKEDYNLVKPGQVWEKATHWKQREKDQPFFAIFNFTISHESKIRNWNKNKKLIHDPKKVRIPAYHPDTPEVRKGWAQYYDQLTAMDKLVGGALQELEEAGLSEDTIVFYYGDHGPGMPRSKRWPYNSGLRVPLVVYIPEKFKHLASPDYKKGEKTDRLVGFIDLAPTVLSLAGIKPPKHFHGNAFLGKYQAQPVSYQHGFRGRMDERYDLVRVVRDQQFIYIRNYMPHKIYGQYIDYMFKTPTTRVWKQLYDEGKLSPPQTYFWETKPAEELYDLKNDPDEVKNLAKNPKYKSKLEELRKAHRDHVFKIRDIGFLPEAQIQTRSKGRTAYEVGRDNKTYDLPKILETAEMASSMDSKFSTELKNRLGSSDPAIRYWAVLGILMRGEDEVKASRRDLLGALRDKDPSVKIIAAEALGRYGNKKDLEAALETLIQNASIQKHGVYVSMLALNAIDILGDKAKPLAEQIKKLPQKAKDTPGRMGNYVPRLLGALSRRLSN